MVSEATQSKCAIKYQKREEKKFSTIFQKSNKESRIFFFQGMKVISAYWDMVYKVFLFEIGFLHNEIALSMP